MRRAVWLLLFCACKNIEPDTQRVVVKDNAMLCMGVAVPAAGDAGRPHAELRAGQTLPVVVRSLGCLSDECATKRQATCSAKREGNRIVVTSELSWTAPGAIGPSCPGSCSMLDATCSIEPLQPGKYTVVHGDKTMTVEVPSEIESGCVDPTILTKPPPIVVHVPDAAPEIIAPIPSAVASVAAVTAPPPATGAPASAEPPPETICVSSVLPRTGKPPKTVPVGIAITHPNKCVGSSCSAAAPKCTAKRKGNVISVSAAFPADGAKPRQPCTEDCRALVASCKTEPIPSGTYTVQVGSHSEEFALPAQSVCKP